MASRWQPNGQSRVLSTLPKILPHSTAFRVIFGFDVFDPTNTLFIVAINLALLK
jgi:hypothetical protein